MKNYSLVLCFIALFTLASCSGNKETNPPETPTPPSTESSGSDMMKEEPAYDATKIDPAAPVVELLLKARGNSMADMSYDQKELRVKAGSTVHLTLLNEGSDVSMVHNFVLIDEGTADKVGPEGLKAGEAMNFVPKMPQVYVATSLTQPKQKTDIRFPAPPKGTYDFICTYPGHYQKMNGKFVVE
jgi:azurin